MTLHFLLSKFTWHPALHNTRMPRSDAIIISGAMCPMSVNGKPGMVTLHLWVDVTFFSIGEGDCDWVDGNMFVFAVCAFHDEEGGSAGVHNGVRGVDHHGVGLMYAAWQLACSQVQCDDCFVIVAVTVIDDQGGYGR
jgi:hypothetical protein